jgi:hypothetical protein
LGWRSGMGSALAGTVISDHQRQVLEGCWRAEVAAERGEARPDRVARRRESFKQQDRSPARRFAADGHRLAGALCRGRPAGVERDEAGAWTEADDHGGEDQGGRRLDHANAAGRSDAPELPDDGQGPGAQPGDGARIWDAHGLKPHGVKTFKLSTDRRFSERLTAVVGLYLNPPEKAIVFCVDGRQVCAAVVDIAGDVGHRPNRADRALRRRLRRGVPQREGGPPRAKNRARTRRRAAE